MSSRALLASLTRAMLVGKMMIDTIDCDYLYPKFAAAYLLTEGSHAAFIDNNTVYSVPLLLQALDARGLKPEQVEYVIVTHVHLDHAGGTAKLMQACPNAKLLAHPRATKHLIDPTKLVESAQAVYGKEAFKKLYGEIGPVPAERVRAMNDEEEIPFGSGHLRFLHTRGHANHHFCVLAHEQKTIFTGDSFGLAYPALQEHGLFILPSTSPTDFDPVEAKKSIDRILRSGATRAYLTHFGAVDDLDGAARQLHAALDFSASLLAEATAMDGDDHARTAHCLRALKKCYADHSPEGLLKMDLELNAQGIAYVAAKARRKA